MPVPTTDKFTQIDIAAHSGAFGDNPLPLPSDSQKKAGNYKKGKVSLYGLTVSIEQPKNSYRTGVDKNGKRWTNRLAANYGYINGTKGNDNDPVDCFIGSYPQSDTVYIINQFVNGVFDEHKVMLCYPAESFARCDYEMSYSRDWNGLHSIVTATIKQFKQWLKNGDMTKPLTASDLPITEIEQMQKIQWDENGLPKNTSVAKIIYDLRKTDDGGQLLDSITVDDVFHDYGKLFDSSETAYLDSLNIPFGKINQTANIIKRELNKKGTKLQVKEPLEGENPNPFISEPFKQNGVAMVSMLFTLSDGQSIKIFFHDPDPTSSKMDKADIIIAWKWMLNKKDITILVSPELGQDVKLATIAQRIMTMAEGNMEAFARANKNLAEQIKTISDLKTEIDSLNTDLLAKQGEFERVKADYDNWLVNKATNPEPAPVVTPENGFTPTHKYHDASEGVDVLIAKNEDGEWEDANGMTYEGIDSEVEPITGEQVAVDDPVTPEPVVTPEPTATQGIDPVAKANIEAANISAAIKKKAIAFLNANPTTHSWEGSGLSKASQKAIMENIKTALFAEIKALSPLFEVFNDYVVLRPNDNIANRIMIGFEKNKSLNSNYKMFFSVIDENNPTQELFDSTQTLEDLRSWGFALPFDLDVKAFVANVIKPVVDEFLANNQQSQISNDYQKIWDNTLDRGYRELLCIKAGWVTGKDDRLTKTGLKISSSKWSELSIAAQKVLMPLIDEFLSKQGSGGSVESDDDKFDRYTSLTNEEVRALSDAEYQDVYDMLEAENYHDLNRAYEAARLGDNDLANRFRAIDDRNMSSPSLSELQAIQTDRAKAQVELYRKKGNNQLADQIMKNYGLTEPTPEPQPQVAETPTNTFDADIEALRGLIGADNFYDVAESLMDKLEAANAYDDYAQIIETMIEEHADARVKAGK